jgi:serine/threonine protein kinase/tetratricopeptide (TPR) repeat protein
MIGETISHYRIIERLGTGGMGEVYKAEDLRLHRPVALKLMLTESQGNEMARQRFLREARAASALNHPNIATIYEIDEVERNGSLYSFIVMEYVSGHTLKEHVERLSVAATVEIVRQIADALTEAHDRGIIHRDIKPSNVMITDGGRVKMLDFGIAKFQPFENGTDQTASLYDTSLMKTAPGMVIGTFAYMSPEQALGQEVDARTDIFSLGVLLYEALAGRLPFEGRSSLAMVDGILHSTPPPLVSFNPRVSPELEAVCLRMLAKDRNERYQNLRDVRHDLEIIAAEFATSAATDPFRTSGSSSSQLLRASVSNYSLSARVGKSLAVMSFVNITGNAADDWLGVGIAETVTADLKRIEGLTVIGRERIYEVLRRMNAQPSGENDISLATRVGHDIGARWIVSGGCQRIGEMIRITARLVEVETGEIVRTVKIDGRMDQIFELQDKIVYELSQGLDFSLRSAEREVIAQDETDVIEAYEAFTKGMMALRSLSPEAIERAVEYFEEAIALDPKYARAYGMRGYATGLKGQFLAKSEFIEAGITDLQKAIELHSETPDAYAGLGMLFIALNRFDEAIGSIRRALAFAPDDAISRAALGRAFFLGKGMFREAAIEFERALAINPFAGWVALQLAHCYAYLGDYLRGEQVARGAVAQQEQFQSGQEGMQIVGAHTRLGHIYALQGRYDDAIAEYYQEIVFLRSLDHTLKQRAMIEVQQKLASAYVRQDNLEDARTSYEAVLSGHERLLAAGSDEPFSRYYVACAAAVLGDAELALTELTEAIRMRRHFIISRARIEPDFESLRSNERFLSLIEVTQ